MTAARAPQAFDPGARAVFGTTPDGRRVDRVAIAGHGLSVGLITWGATIQDVRLAGYPQPLVLGYPVFPPYLVEGKSCGAIVGRFANRIGGASAFIGGAQRRLDANFLGRHTLHGGSDGTGVRPDRHRVVVEGSQGAVEVGGHHQPRGAAQVGLVRGGLVGAAGGHSVSSASAITAGSGSPAGGR